MSRRNSWGGGGDPLRNASPHGAGGRAVPAAVGAGGAGFADDAAAAFAGLHAAEARAAAPLWEALAKALAAEWAGVVDGLRARSGDRLAAGWVRAHGAELPSGRAPLAVLLAVLPDDLGEARALVAHTLGTGAAEALLREVGGAPVEPAAYARAQALLVAQNCSAAEACRRLLSGPHVAAPSESPDHGHPASTAPPAVQTPWAERALAALLRAAERAALAVSAPPPLVPAYRDAGAGRAPVRHLVLPCGDARVHVACSVDGASLVLRVAALDAAGRPCPGVEVSVGSVVGPRVAGTTDRHGVVTQLRCEGDGTGGPWELHVREGAHVGWVRWDVPA